MNRFAAGAGVRSETRDRTDLVLVVLLLALALLVRLPGLAQSELWIDEANTSLIALKGPAGIVTALSVDGNPPLYYLLLHFWQRIFGIGEVAVRFLSVLMGVALVPLLYTVGKSWSGRLAGAMSALFVALSPIHVYYSREVRMYSLMPLLGMAVILALDRLLLLRNRKALILAAVCLAASLYTHNYALFLLPVGPIAALFVSNERKEALLMTSLASGLALLMASPWIPVVLRQSAHGGGNWISDLFERETGSSIIAVAGEPGQYLAAILRSFEVMSPGASYPQYLRKLPVESFTGIFSLSLVLAALAAGVLLGRRPAGCGSITPEHSRARIALLACGLVVPMLLPIAYSVMIKPIYLIGRYEILTFGFTALLVGIGVSGIRDRIRVSFLRVTVPITFGIVITLLSSVSLFPYLFGESSPTSNARRVAVLLEQWGEDGDVILFCEWTRATSEYAIRRRGLDARFAFLSFPEEAGRHLGWYDAPGFRSRVGELNEEATSLIRRTHQRMNSGATLWLLYESRYPELHETLLQELLMRFGHYKDECSEDSVGLYCFVK